MAGGILDLIEFAVAVVFAAPVALLGVILAADGDPVGGVAFLVIAIGMVAFDRYVVAPRDLATGLLVSVVGRIAGSHSDEGD